MGAIVLGNLAALPAATLNTVAAAYLLLRTGYTLAYLNIETTKPSYLRSACWATGTSVLIYWYVVAGNVLAKSAPVTV